MTTNNDTTNSPWHLAQRCARMNPSVIREILKLTELPGVRSLAGGLPSADHRNMPFCFVHSCGSQADFSGM